MKSVSLLLLAAAVLLGGASAVTTYLLLGHGSAGGRGAAPPATPDPGPDPELVALSERIEALVEELRDQEMRLATLEGRPVREQRIPIEGFAAKSELEALREEVQAALARRVVPDTEPEELREQVAGALIDLRKQEAQSKVREYQEKRAARLEEDVAKIADWLALNGYQRDEVRGILLAQYEREEEVRRLWEEGVEDELLGERKQSGVALFRADLEQVLTPEQLDTFWTRIAGGGKN